MKVSVVIPCFNEEESLLVLFEKMDELSRKNPQMEWEFIFVDDGSTDRTQELLKAFQNTVISASERKNAPANTPTRTVKIVAHERNRGVGQAMRTGFENASGDIICTLDADCTYDPLMLSEMVELLVRENADIITASPYHPEGGVKGVPVYRLILSKGLSVLYRLILFPKAARIHTFSAGFRAYRSVSLKDIKFTAGDFLVNTEIMVEAIRKNMKVIEIPMLLKGRAHGASKMKIFKTIKSHLRYIFSILFKRQFTALEE